MLRSSTDAAMNLHWKLKDARQLHNDVYYVFDGAGVQRVEFQRTGDEFGF